MRHPLSNVYHGMKNRCYKSYSASYHNYGARGIRVCDRWLNSFKAFCDDMGPRPTTHHTLERKDNNGNYEPSNCVWATAKQQANNTRASRVIAAFGERKTLSEWADVSPVTYHSIKRRLNAGWDAERAISEPMRAMPATRNSYNNIELSVAGQTRTVGQWRKLHGIPHQLFWQRLHVQGWSIEDACTVPVVIHGFSKEGLRSGAYQQKGSRAQSLKS